MSKSIVPPRVPNRRCFTMLAAFSRIPLPFEPSSKIVRLPIAVDSRNLTWTRSVASVAIRGSARPSVYFDLARAVSFDAIVVNLVALRPHIVTKRLLQ